MPTETRSAGAPIANRLGNVQQDPLLSHFCTTSDIAHGHNVKVVDVGVTKESSGYVTGNKAVHDGAAHGEVPAHSEYKDMYDDLALRYTNGNMPVLAGSTVESSGFVTNLHPDTMPPNPSFAAEMEKSADNQKLRRYLKTPLGRLVEPLESEEGRVGLQPHSTTAARSYVDPRTTSGAMPVEGDVNIGFMEDNGYTKNHNPFVPAQRIAVPENSTSHDAFTETACMTGREPIEDFAPMMRRTWADVRRDDQLMGPAGVAGIQNAGYERAVVVGTIPHVSAAQHKMDGLASLSLGALKKDDPQEYGYVGTPAQFTSTNTIVHGVQTHRTEPPPGAAIGRWEPDGFTNGNKSIKAEPTITCDRTLPVAPKGSTAYNESFQSPSDATNYVATCGAGKSGYSRMLGPSGF